MLKIWYTSFMSSQKAGLNPLIAGWSTIFLLAALGLFVAVLLSFIPSLEYSSTTRLLITQQLGAVDAYTASRSAERVSEDLANAVYTSTFFESVLNSGYDISESDFSDDEIKRRKTWGKTISTSVSRGTGLLAVKAYHEDVNKAQEYATAVASVLSQQGWTYTSGGNITVQVVDEPLNSRFPVRPNILVNGFSGFILGGLAGVGFLLIQHERTRRRHKIIHD
jgi:capsular polysaccharide biosynthesis protein